MKVFGLLFLLLSVNGAKAIVKPADGLWHTADDPAIGSGLVLTTQNDLTLISLFTYSENGENIWYVGSGQIDEEGILEVNLYQTQDGQNLLIEHPQSATHIDETDLLKIEFLGSNRATLQINGSEVKIITPLHFGHDISYGFPDLSGQWAVANLATNQSYVLDLSLEFEGQLGSQIQYCYVTANSNISGCIVSCHINLAYPNTNKCVFSDPHDEGGLVTFVGFENLGNKKLQGKTQATNTDFDFQLFRINQAPNILPNDGHWRTVDDPDVGSGLVMRTQGGYTVVLIYSYDEAGKPEWKIASGQFDENGLFSAELFTPFGGSSIQNMEPFVAQIEPQSQTIEVQLDGLELARLSIDGSAPKMIQNYNFGTGVFSTDHYMLDDNAFNYPDQTGRWLMVNQDLSVSRLVNFSYFDPNWSATPPSPRIYGARSYRVNRNDDNDFYLEFTCLKILSYDFFVYDVVPYCTGRLFERPESADIKFYFEDIGHRKFRGYFDGFDDDERNFETIDRNSEYFDFYRVD
ncbi:MAG: hypothetical protein R3E90_11995 [Marinicella sp.]|nr:hypothetical protein [Xanthomonadales bacterium]